MKFRYIAYTAMLALVSTLTQAQVKIGKNPTTISPNALLDIEGSTTTTRTVSLTNGNFGIGTSTPANALDVNGSIYSFSGSSANGSVKIDPGNSSNAGTISFLRPNNNRVGFIGANTGANVNANDHDPLQ